MIHIVGWLNSFEGIPGSLYLCQVFKCVLGYMAREERYMCKEGPHTGVYCKYYCGSVAIMMCVRSVNVLA